MGSGCESESLDSQDPIGSHERGRAGSPYWGYTHSPAILIMLRRAPLICVTSILHADGRESKARQRVYAGPTGILW